MTEFIKILVGSLVLSVLIISWVAIIGMSKLTSEQQMALHAHEVNKETFMQCCKTGEIHLEPFPLNTESTDLKNKLNVFLSDLVPDNLSGAEFTKLVDETYMFLSEKLKGE